MKAKTKTDLHFEIAHLRARLEVARLKEMHLLSEIVALKEQRETPDCAKCANRGHIKGLSHETYCDHCAWQQQWRSDWFAPRADEGRQT